MAVQNMNFDKEKLRQYIRKNFREIMSWVFIIAIISYIWMATSIQTFAKALVSGLLIYGGFEAVNRIRGKKSYGDLIKKEIGTAHKNQANMFGSMNIGFPQTDQFFPGQERPRRKRR